MRILIDLDGVLHKAPPNEPEEKVTGKPMEGAIAALEMLHEEGHDLSVFTARKNLIAVRNWLEDHIFSEIEWFPFPVSNIKTHSDLYIDDQAIHFADWDQTLEEIDGLTLPEEQKNPEIVPGKSTEIDMDAWVKKERAKKAKAPKSKDKYYIGDFADDPVHHGEDT